MLYSSAQSLKLRLLVYYLRSYYYMLYSYILYSCTFYFYKLYLLACSLAFNTYIFALALNLSFES